MNTIATRATYRYYDYEGDGLSHMQIDTALIAITLTNPANGTIPHDPLPLVKRTRTQEPPIPFIFQIPPLSSPRLHSPSFSRPTANPKLPGEESSLAIQLRSHGERFDRRHPDSYELHVGQEHRCCKQCEEAGPAGYKTEKQSFVSNDLPGSRVEVPTMQRYLSSVHPLIRLETVYRPGPRRRISYISSTTSRS